MRPKFCEAVSASILFAKVINSLQNIPLAGKEANEVTTQCTINAIDLIESKLFDVHFFTICNLFSKQRLFYKCLKNKNENHFVHYS